MTRHVDDPHELLRALEAQGHAQDIVMRRVIDHLRDMIADRQAIEAIVHRQNITTAARTAFLVEAYEILLEGEEQQEVVTLSKFRRPQLRLVQ